MKAVVKHIGIHMRLHFIQIDRSQFRRDFTEYYDFGIIEVGNGDKQGFKCVPSLFQPEFPLLIQSFIMYHLP